MTSRPKDMEASLHDCFDRGQEYLNEANKRGLWHNSLPNIEMSFDEVNQRFSTEKKTKKCAENIIIERIEAIESTTFNAKSIIHLQALRRAITPELVHEVLARYKAYPGETQLMEAALKICSSYCKVFAILLRFSKGKFITSFMVQNIDDSNLPLQGEYRDGKYGVSLKNGLFGTMEGWRKNEWQNFFNWQWNFLTPFFARPDGKVLHYHLMSDDILPIIDREDYEREGKDHRGYDSSPKTQKPLQIKRKPAAYGGHSTVSKIKLDPLSCDFGDFRVRSSTSDLHRLLTTYSSKTEMDGTH